jgi:O-antigen ligase
MTPKRVQHSSSRASRSPFQVQKITVQDTVLTVILAMIVIVPLVAGTDYLNNFGKPLVFEVLGCILLALMASQISFGSETLRALSPRLKLGPTLAIIGLVLYSMCTYFIDPTARHFELTARAEVIRLFFCGLVYVTLALYVQGEGRLQILLDVLLGVGAIVAVISLCSLGMTSGKLDIHGTFGTHETLGSFLLMVLPLALPIALTDLGEQRRQIFAQIVTLLVAAALLMAYTRASWLGSAVALFVLAVLYLVFQAQRKPAMNNAERVAMWVGPPFIMIAAVALFILTSQQGAALSSRASTIAHLSADGSGQIRLKLAKGAVHMIEAKPLLGWGPGTFPLMSYRFTGVGRTSQEILSSGTTLDNNAHSFYLQFGAEEGAFGLIFFMVVVVLFLWTTIRALPNMPTGLRKCVVIGSTSACVGQLIDAAISPSYNLPAISMFQFVVFGIGVLAARGLELPVHLNDIPPDFGSRLRQRISPNTLNTAWAKQHWPSDKH